MWNSRTSGFCFEFLRWDVLSPKGASERVLSPPVWQHRRCTRPVFMVVSTWLHSCPGASGGAWKPRSEPVWNTSSTRLVQFHCLHGTEVWTPPSDTPPFSDPACSHRMSDFQHSSWMHHQSHSILKKKKKHFLALRFLVFCCYLRTRSEERRMKNSAVSRLKTFMGADRRSRSHGSAGVAE